MTETKEKSYPESAIREALDDIGFTGALIDEIMKNIETYSILADAYEDLQEGRDKV